MTTESTEKDQKAYTLADALRDAREQRERIPKASKRAMPSLRLDYR